MANYFVFVFQTTGGADAVAFIEPKNKAESRGDPSKYMNAAMKKYDKGDNPISAESYDTRADALSAFNAYLARGFVDETKNAGPDAGDPSATRR